jgi:hypothetical protein
MPRTNIRLCAWYRGFASEEHAWHRKTFSNGIFENSFRLEVPGGWGIGSRLLKTAALLKPDLY